MVKDNELGALILGGIIGAALAAPKQQEKQELQEYRTLKQKIALRQNKIGELPNFIKFMSKPQYYNAFIEAYKMHLYGFFRGSTIISSAVIEALLKDRYGDKQFYVLIGEAHKDMLISKSEYFFLHGIREERNDSSHNIIKEIREEDADIVLKLTIKILNKLLK